MNTKRKPVSIEKWHFEIKHPLDFPDMKDFTIDMAYLEAGELSIPVEPKCDLYIMGLASDKDNKLEEINLRVVCAFRANDDVGIILLCEDDVTYYLDPNQMLSYEHYNRWSAAYAEFMGELN